MMKIGHVREGGGRVKEEIRHQYRRAQTGDHPRQPSASRLEEEVQESTHRNHQTAANVKLTAALIDQTTVTQFILRRLLYR